MPAMRIIDQVDLVRRFDVLGLDSEDVASLVRHVGLAGEDRSKHKASEPFPIIHMRPPLGRDEIGEPMQSHGSAELSVDETLQIGAFVDELADEYEALKGRDVLNQYIVSPPMKDKVEEDGTTTYRRFSCAGFVIAAYRYAGIKLMSMEVADLPAVDLTTLIDHYPEQATRLRKEVFRRRIGLEGEGPWNIILAGYIINSLARTPAEIRAMPYQPRAGDEFFPSRPS